MVDVTNTLALSDERPLVGAPVESTLRPDVELGSTERDLRDLVADTIAPERMTVWIR